MKGYRTSTTNQQAQIEKYCYDDLYQLIRADYPNGDVQQWSYDDIGNRVQQIVTPYGQSPIVTNYMYYQNSQSKNSQLLQSDGINTYTWDNNGNLLTKAATSYTWDYDDRLVGISGPSISAAYGYDFQKNRIKKTTGGMEMAYLYLADDIIKETTGGAITDYLHGTGTDEPVMLDRAGSKSYYYSDGLGSIREVTDDTGVVQNLYTYGVWGELRVQNVTVPNSYGYTGREFSEDGLYFFRARYMDPGVGRFLSEDKIKLFLRMKHYAYCLNSPIEFRDPMGLDCKIEWHRGKDILVGTPWIEREFDGYYEAKFWCSLYMGIVIMYNWFYLGDEPYPDFCKYKITNYLVAWFQPTNDYYNVCRDKCGKVTKRELIYNGKWGKPYKATLDWWEEWAYVLN